MASLLVQMWETLLPGTMTFRAARKNNPGSWSLLCFFSSMILPILLPPNLANVVFYLFPPLATYPLVIDVISVDSFVPLSILEFRKGDSALFRNSLFGLMSKYFAAGEVVFFDSGLEVQGP